MIPLSQIPGNMWERWYSEMAVTEMAAAFRVSKKTILDCLKKYKVIKPGTARRPSRANFYRKKH